MKKLLLFLAVIIGFTAFSQVNTNNTSGPNVCDGSAYLTDSTATVISWNGSNGTIQNGGTYLGNLCAGTYSVVVSNGQGATVSYTFTIAAGTSNPCANFYATANVTVTSAPAACDGSATILPNGGSAPYTFNWSNQGMLTSNTATNLCAGQYSVSVTDANGCATNVYFSTADSTSGNPCNGFFATSTTTATDPNACTGTMTISVVGGVPPYTYQGNNLNNGPYLTGLCTGTYTVSVIDNSGCSTSVVGSVTNNGATPGDTIILNGNVGNDSTVIGNVDGNWLSNCTFDYNTVDSANVISLQSGSNSTYVTWVIYTSTGDSIFVTDTYNFPNGNGTYTITLQVYCSQKTGPKYLIANDKVEYSLAGIGENNIDFTVYPNPVSEKLNMDGTAGESFVITDISGKVVSSGKTSVHTTIDASSWSIGFYVVKIGSKSIQFIKR